MGFGKIILAASAVAAIGYGIAYYLREKKLIASTTISPVGYTTKSFTLDAAQVEVFYELQNDSDITFNVYRQSYAASVNGKDIGNAFSLQSVYVPAHSKVKSSLMVEFSPRTVILTGLQNLSSIGTVAVKVVGSVGVTSGGILLSSIPMNFEIKINDIISKL